MGLLTTKWSITQLIWRLLLTNCLSMFEDFLGCSLKGSLRYLILMITILILTKLKN